ncbi:carboxypeptidase-like regulatory domain-containing protein, partial [Planctomycetota bacterium]
MRIQRLILFLVVVAALAFVATRCFEAERSAQRNPTTETTQPRSGDKPATERRLPATPGTVLAQDTQQPAAETATAEEAAPPVWIDVRSRPEDPDTGAGIVGMVVDAAGAPVEGVKVQAEPFRDPGVHSFVTYPHAKTGADGCFEISDLNPWQRVQLRLQPTEGFLETVYGAPALEAARTAAAGRLLVFRGGSIVGHVVDEQGRTCHVGSVVAELEDPDLAAWIVEDWQKLRTRPDETGAFEMAGIRPGRYRITAEHGALTGETFATVSEGAATTIQVQLGSLRVVNVSVRDPEGRPLRARLKRPNPEASPHIQPKTAVALA